MGSAKIARQVALPGGGTICKKTSKDDVKHLFWPWKIQPVTAVLIAYLRVLVRITLVEKSRQDLATVASVFTGGEA